ncbi:MAG: lipid-A-disaccharide synthase [Snowella sp.]|nr:lipid-A-disaccharide synthase [Snowella sp.]
MQSVDILILSNGPGEITTWVRPVVTALRHQLGTDSTAVRISVILSPCPHATGKEAAIAASYPEVDRVQSSEHFFDFLLWGKTAENWDWRETGVVLFLGGDQVFPLVIGKRLGYRTVIYAEWEARWYRWVDAFGVMNESVWQNVPENYRHKLTITGDLMADVSQSSIQADPHFPIIGLLPGSKAGKLTQGVPFVLAIAEKIAQCKPETRFIIPVAPTLDLETLARYANPDLNPLVKKMGNVSGELVIQAEKVLIKTSGGLSIELVTQFPAHEVISQFTLALTTVGANTAELGSLAIPMIVLLPTQQLDAMRSWDGLPGVLARLPGVGTAFAKLINGWMIKQKRLYAWPNIWAKSEIVPELIGELKPEEVADKVIHWLDHPDQLAQIRDRLIQVRGKPGAATAIANLVQQQLTSPTNQKFED